MFLYDHCHMAVKKIFVLLFLSVSFKFIFSQPQKNFDPGNLSANFIAELKKSYGNKKQYPPQFEKQILLALSHYPELKNTPIEFRLQAKHSPLFTRVSWGGLFERGYKRHFVIIISDSTEKKLAPILFKNLPFNAQVGVLGHELAHVSDFCRMSIVQVLQHVIKSVAYKYVDGFEFNTDAICIAHGLGYQLLAWSSFIREKMQLFNWGGPDQVNHQQIRERYMNPATIIKRIGEDPPYQAIR